MNLQYVETGQITESYRPTDATISSPEITEHFFEQALGRELDATEKALVQEIWEQIRLEEVDNEAN